MHISHESVGQKVNNFLKNFDAPKTKHGIKKANSEAELDEHLMKVKIISALIILKLSCIFFLQ